MVVTAATLGMAQAPRPEVTAGAPAKSVVLRCAALLDGRSAGFTADPDTGSISGMVRARHYDDSNALCAYIPGMLNYFDIPDLDSWREK
jgi:hypothetical protein